MLLRLRPGDFGRLFSEGIEPEPAAAARRATAAPASGVSRESHAYGRGG